MKIKDTNQLPLSDLKAEHRSYASVILNKARLAEVLTEASALNNFDSFKNRIVLIKSTITNPTIGDPQIMKVNGNGDGIALRKDVLLSELDQVLESQTLERAKYYAQRLKKGVEKIKTSKINDINLLRWKEYDNILTDSLWLLNKRDNSGVHIASYWGNFIPQIPHQMMLRYTKKGEYVLDTFVGSGTTLIECRRLGRHGIGIELDKGVAKKAKELISEEENPHGVTTNVVIGDSRLIDIEKILKGQGVSKVQLLIMHPPYHDIIKFSQNENDLSNAVTTEKFLEMFGAVVDNASPFLEKGRYFAVVIGDKYSKGEWIPLGFYCMNEVLKRGYLLKSIIVKNFDETRGKRSQKELWRYRAIVGGFYVFKHEYVMLFQRKK